jgi:hypothetical protein
VKDLEGGAVEVLWIPSGLGKFIGKAGDLGKKAWGIGGGLIHFQLSGYFDLLLIVVESDGSEEVGGLIGAGVARNFERVEPNGEGQVLEFEAKADAGCSVWGGENGRGSGGNPAGGACGPIA